MSTNFSAREPMLGYLHQVRYALLLLLQSQDEVELSLETLDDLTLEENGSPSELLQLKHHGKPGALTNGSADLWKTIRVWASGVSTGQIHLDGVILTLVTTADAPADSVAAMLRADHPRDVDGVVAALTSVAETSDNCALKSSFDAFLSLSSHLRRGLVARIHILTGALDISQVTEAMHRELRLAVRPQHVGPLRERLEGWWFEKTVNHLRTSEHATIKGYELRDRIHALAEQFRPDALPIDFADAVPPEGIDASTDERQFVRQLKMISVNSRRIANAMLDYYRAFQQRSRWAREDLLFGPELETYENRLVDAWDRHLLALLDEGNGEHLENEALLEIGKRLYKWAELEADIRIRPDVSHEYVMRGSYHLLADTAPPRVWWHPRFRERVAELWSEATEGER